CCNGWFGVTPATCSAPVSWPPSSGASAPWRGGRPRRLLPDRLLRPDETDAHLHVLDEPLHAGRKALRPQPGPEAVPEELGEFDVSPVGGPDDHVLGPRPELPEIAHPDLAYPGPGQLGCWPVVAEQPQPALADLDLGQGRCPGRADIGQGYDHP